MDIFYALAEPRRRNILELLSLNGKLSATDICKRFQVSAAAISQHLKVLKESKLVKMQKRGQQRIYEINPAALSELELWARKLTTEWESRFDALDELLESEKKKLKDIQ